MEDFSRSRYSRTRCVVSRIRPALCSLRSTGTVRPSSTSSASGVGCDSPSTSRDTLAHPPETAGATEISWAGSSAVAETTAGWAFLRLQWGHFQFRSIADSPFVVSDPGGAKLPGGAESATSHDAVVARNWGPSHGRQ